MTLSEGGVALVVGLVIASVVAILAITAYMCRLHRRKSVRLDTPIFKRLVREDSARSSHSGGLGSRGGSKHSRGPDFADECGVPQQLSPTASVSSRASSGSHAAADHFDELGARGVETHTTLIIPNGLQLLKTVKRLTHRLMATVIDFTSSNNGQGLVVGSKDEIVSCAKTVSESVDALTKSMYPPICDADILTNATELVNATEDLVLVSKFNCKQDKLDWLDKATKDVLHDFKVLVDSVQKYRNLHKKHGPDHHISDA